MVLEKWDIHRGKRKKSKEKKGKEKEKEKERTLNLNVGPYTKTNSKCIMDVHVYVKL